MGHQPSQKALAMSHSSQPFSQLKQSFACHGAWDGQHARFQECFLPVISLLPGILAIIVLGFRVSRPLLRRRPQWLRNFVQDDRKSDQTSEVDAKRQLTAWTLALLALCCIGLTLDVTAFLWPHTNFTALLPTISWATVILLLAVDKPAAAPLGCLVILTCIFIVQLVFHLNNASNIRTLDIPSILSTSAALASVVIILNMPLQDPVLPSSDIAAPFAIPSSSLRSPEELITPWQYMSVSWMSPLLSIGSKRQLNDEDVWSLAHDFQHQELHSRFRELKGTVVVRLLKANGLDLLILTGLGLLELTTRYAGPTLLQLLLRSMEESDTPVRAAVVYAFITFMVRLVKLQSGIFSTWYGRRCYERSRGEMITMLHEKVLHRKIVGATAGQNEGKDKDGNHKAATNGPVDSDNKGKHKSYNDKKDAKWWARIGKKAGKKDKDDMRPTKEPAKMGKILNLMQGDVYDVAQRFWDFQELVTVPIGLVLSVLLVWRLIGWPALFGGITIIIAQLVNVGLGKLTLKMERVRRAATDSRLQKSSQFVEAIRHLRWYGWQEHWLEKILTARIHELKKRIQSSVLYTLIHFMNTLASNLSPVVAFYAYTRWAGLPLRVDIAFPALQLFQYLESGLRAVPDLIMTLLRARIAVRRIEDFMAEPNRDEENTTANGQPIDTRLAVEDASFAWPGTEKQILQDITLNFPVGLTVILGEVGSGKTALLEALLGEMDTHKGAVIRSKFMYGYCAQTPWLQSMSIKDNILFSYPVEEQRYKDVLEVCQLNPDLDSFKDGDSSLIGENGIGLSGGQRARVALARAVYSHAPTLLLDDPLSALDHQTADAIVRQCFRGPLMEGRTTILVTHRVDLVQDIAQQMVEISASKARVLNRGTSLDSLSKIVSNRSLDDYEEEVKKEDVGKKDAEKFLEDEKRVHGGVKIRVYWEYVKAGHLKFWALLFAFMVLSKAFNFGENYFLKEWSEAYDQLPTVSSVISGIFDKFPSPEEDVVPWLWAFFGIAVARSIISLVNSLSSIIIIFTAGKGLFEEIMRRVSHATFRFYDVTPVGRLMNRLTSDMGTVDGGLSYQLRGIVFLIITWISSVAIIASVTPVFLVFSIILSATFVLIFSWFLPTSQSLRRLEMVSLSPLMSNFGQLLHGLTTVRAFAAQSRFQDSVIRTVDSFQKMDHFYWSLQMWLSYRYDTLSALSTFILTLLALYTGVSPGLTAFVLVAASQYVMATHSLCKSYGRMQMSFVSVERVVELLHLDQEPQGTIGPPAAWPVYGGDIVFQNVTIRYAPHLEPALRNVSFTIPGGSTTALLGRTGSGKSTLALSLLATTTPDEGTITIDGIDVSQVNTQALRHRITFLAQDPVLFPGSMRQNLDPLNSYSDDECSGVLERICGKHGWTLDTVIDTGGQNLSQGQRQLVGLARAVLRRSSVIILDEATASIDRETAEEVQRMLREEMQGSTVVTIAHRIEAVRGVDFFVRLDHGRVIEQGPVTERTMDKGKAKGKSNDASDEESGNGEGSSKSEEGA